MLKKSKIKIKVLYGSMVQVVPIDCSVNLEI